MVDVNGIEIAVGQNVALSVTCGRKASLRTGVIKFVGKYGVDIVTTGEQMNKTATLESLSNILTLTAQNPMILQDPVLKEVFARIVEVAGLGISPVELLSKPQQMMQPQQGQAPQGQQQGQPGQSSLPDPNSIGAGRETPTA